MKPRFRSKLFLTLFVGVLALFALRAEAGQVFTDSDGAIRGYDMVAYFTDGKARQGSAEFSHTWNGAEWRFASAANRDAFAANPEKYAPQYGGWCSWAVSKGYTAPTDPEAWSIVDGRLFLNYSKGVHARWSSNLPTMIAEGDRNWPDIKKGL